jgi:serine O-acetyltransferase
MGRIYIGANATISANTVVLKDVPPQATAMGVPARIVRAQPKDGGSEGIDP